MKHVIKIGAIILDKKKRILISRNKGCVYWTFVGGKLEEGELHIDCLRRELKEEIGVEQIENIRFYAKSPIVNAVGKKDVTVEIYAYFVDIKQNPKPCSEIEEIHWLSFQEFQENKFQLGSILKENIIPKLGEEGCIM